MRDYKFRAWDSVEKKWLFGYDMLNGEGGFHMFGEVVLMGEWGAAAWKTIGENEPERIKLMQYTGLKDKNDVEIYEGDIIKQTIGNCWWIYVVRADEQPNSQFGNTLFCWTIKDNFAESEDGRLLPSGKERTLEFPARSYVASGSFVEIIGDIYKNPDLLPKQEGGGDE